MSFGRYQFLSWARRGAARHITEKDTLGKSSGSAEERARIPLTVELSTGAPESHILALIGPGDITNVSAKTMIRTEPRNGVGDYEPNLLPYIEFYDEEFPFRYTPAAPASSGKHLRPWVALIVLRENEFLETNRREPLPSIKLASEAYLPPSDELHLWCHMHSNLPHEESDFEAFLDGLEEDVKTDPDGVYSRLLCPRKLEPRTLYHAFLVPSYETGRRAGLGQPITGIKAQKPSWPGQDLELPVYHRWSFRTGKNFDFEYAVKQLKPRIMPDRVGVREMDCSRPGFVRANVDEEVRSTNPDVLMLGGAVMAPDAQLTNFPPNSVAQPFLDDVEALINLNRTQLENQDEDPYVSIPFYGMRHAMRRDTVRPGKKIIPTFVPASDAWYNHLNRDPANRVPAGFGKRVVQENQERFISMAWKQLSAVLEANRKMQIARLAAEVLGKLYAKTIAKKRSESFLLLANSMAKRVMFGNKTVRAAVDESIIANATVDSAFARVTRNNSTIVRNLDARFNAAPFTFDKLFRKSNRVNGISAEVPEPFEVSPKLNNVTTFASPSTASQVRVWSSQSNLAADFAFNQPTFTGGLPQVNLWNATFSPDLFSVATPRPTVTVPFAGVSRPTVSRLSRGGVAVGRTATAGAVGLAAATAAIRDILLIDVSIANNNLSAAPHNANIRSAYRDISTRFEFEIAEVTGPVLRTNSVKNALDAAIRPEHAYVRLSDRLISWPAGTIRPPAENLLPAMAYPDIPDAMYKHLVDIDKEFLLPNLNLIENNTLSLLKTNQRFIESYLCGLSTEFGRELLFREYPSDGRGTYFRQFWDVSGFVTPDTTPTDAESMKDIKPLHTWSSTSELGKHNARDPEGDTEQLVFVIRGDLLRKFPNTVIFAQKALKDPESSDTSDTVIRTGTMSDAQYTKEIRFPLYQAEIEPDIKLLGFNLTIDEAAGRERTPGFGDKRGWYFVLAEVPGEPRFGMDIDFRPNDASALSWNDLSWKNLPDNVDFARATVTPNLNVQPGVSEKWGSSSSHMASILLQRPVMVAIHATEMLDIKVAPELDFHTTFSLTEHITKLGMNFR